MAAWEAIDYINQTGCNRLMPGKTVEEYSKIFYNKDIMASDEAIFIRLKEMGYVLRVSGMPIYT